MPNVPMPIWAKIVWIVSVVICAQILYELVQGNRAILILLGCAIPFVLFGLWQVGKGDDEHAD